MSDVEPIEILMVVLDSPDLDEIVKPVVVATPSQDVQKIEADDEDPEEMEVVAEGRSDSDVLSYSLSTYSTYSNCKQISIFKVTWTRIALLEALVSDLRDQLLSIHIDLWIRIEEIKSLIEFQTAEFTLSIREARLTCNNCDNNLTVRSIMTWDWWRTFRAQTNELKKFTDKMTITIRMTSTTILHDCNIFSNKDRYLRPYIVNWVHWFST
ncbi:hypothetical protein CJ030_MR2G027156 [Morella rubra]|uniref:Uncharacterized protein n=1 Tax=Morella rubra TaxID=262757 RepID=A0A6A1WC25_9ROSI|nr:hypothetical protein CJ030_MR2G027156 [Morella rubra]